MKYYFILLLTIIFFNLQAQTTDKPILPPPSEDESIFMIVEQSPRFPGCEDEDKTKSEKEQCSSKKMLEFIYGNLEYPKEAKENGTEGQVVIQFVVWSDGSLRNITLVRPMEHGCGEEAMRVVHLMNEMEEKWIPGTQRGRAVNVKYTLPIKFKIEG